MSSAKEQIDKAIGAHGMWKARLRQAIDTGKSEFKPEVVRTDHACDFGKWLFGDISPELKQSIQYPTVVKYHAEFHAEAGRVLQLAVAGKKADAEAALSASSKFASISAALTSTMMEWKRAVQ